MDKQEKYNLKRHYNIILNNINKPHYKKYNKKNILIVLKELK